MKTEKILRAFSNPVIIRRNLRIPLARLLTKETYDSVRFLEEDWDTLVILDACRYDLFADYNPFNVAPTKVHSNASHTQEFLQKNFGSESFPDTIYVTASPQLATSQATFAHVEHVWEDNWDEEYRTVLPSNVTDTALEIAEAYPNKRLIVHYMQPHYPFIGQIGQSIESQATFVPNPKQLSIWEKLAAGDVDEATVKEAYAENLEVVLPEVQRLTDSIRGKTVLTSDHGNLFGKRVTWLPFRIYGHPAGIADSELTAVPWVELPFDERRQIVDADETSPQLSEFSNVQDRLEDLGYL